MLWGFVTNLIIINFNKIFYRVIVFLDLYFNNIIFFKNKIDVCYVILFYKNA